MITPIVKELKELVSVIKQLGKLKTVIIENFSMTLDFPQDFELNKLPKLNGVQFLKKDKTLIVKINVEKL